MIKVELLVPSVLTKVPKVEPTGLSCVVLERKTASQRSVTEVNETETQKEFPTENPFGSSTVPVPPSTLETTGTISSGLLFTTCRDMMRKVFPTAETSVGPNPGITWKGAESTRLPS